MTVEVYVPAKALPGIRTPTVGVTSILPRPVLAAALKNLAAEPVDGQGIADRVRRRGAGAAAVTGLRRRRKRLLAPVCGSAPSENVVAEIVMFQPTPDPRASTTLSTGRIRDGLVGAVERVADRGVAGEAKADARGAGNRRRRGEGAGDRDRRGRQGQRGERAESDEDSVPHSGDRPSADRGSCITSIGGSRRGRDPSIGGTNENGPVVAGPFSGVSERQRMPGKWRKGGCYGPVAAASVTVEV